jgi:hypothetical protein
MGYNAVKSNDKSTDFFSGLHFELDEEGNTFQRTSIGFQQTTQSTLAQKI